MGLPARGRLTAGEREEQVSFGQFVLAYVSGMCGLAGLRHLAMASPGGPWNGRRARQTRGGPAPDVRPALPRSPETGPDLVRYTGRRPAPVSVALPETVLEGRSSLQADGGCVGQVTIRAASCRGSAHMRDGKPRQDAFLVSASADGRWIIAAVADGVGSTAHPEVAAQAAVAAAVRLTERAIGPGGLGPHGWEPIFRQVADEIGDRLAALDGAAGNPRPGRTTLLVLLAPADPRPGRTAQLAGVGDSPALLLRPAAGEWSLVLGPGRTSGRVQDDVTAALPPGVDELRTAALEWRPGEVLLLATDGFANALGNRSELSVALAAEWERPPHLLGFIRDVDFRRATFTDDRTVVALWPGTHDRRH
ncbi:protein phosphatase 2C domain-containing protein [Actinomadura chokoriensis]|uniref:Protein phosphatase 2C domain-containing protein n=1 Tax=Actinomadura chokoriensis TaxID=454156 RepID=A0ABV4R5U1_9ACTN